MKIKGIFLLTSGLTPQYSGEMSIIFISDLHLSEGLPGVTAKFREYLGSLPAECEALYILGDLFEVWIGDDAVTPFQLEMAELLHTVSKQCPIYFMAGNRDFLLGNDYCAKAGMTYIKDPSVINLYGCKILLAHGDSLCTQDKFYQFYRSIVRSRIFKAIFLSLPLNYRNSIATKMRQRSQQGNQHKSDELMDVDHKALKKLMKKHDCHQIIYGHTHRPSICFYDLNSTIKKVFVLSDWHKQGNALIFTGNSLSKLVYF